MPSYKLQVQEDDANPTNWNDVKSGDGKLVTFNNEGEARAHLDEKYPILTKMEKFAAGPKRTRVVIINPYQDIDKEKED